MKRATWLQMGLRLAAGLAISGSAITWAQTLSPTTAALQSDCSLAQAKYIGPLSDATRIVSDDPYVWFVTPDFAKRFCMPPGFVDVELKGALAIAVGMVPDPQFKTCKRTSERQVSCNTPLHLMLDIYIDNRAVKLPKTDASIEFFKAWPETSADAITYRSWRADERRKGVQTEVAGERRPYQPIGFNAERDQNWTSFNLLGVRGSWASAGGGLVEKYYRANWMPGIDLLRLSVGDRYGGMPNPVTKEVHPRDSEKNLPIQRWAIGAIMEKDKPQVGGFDPNVWKVIPYPAGYLHTIELPLNLARLIYEYDQKSGTAFFGEMQKRFEQATGDRAPIFTPPSSK